MNCRCFLRMPGVALRQIVAVVSVAVWLLAGSATALAAPGGRVALVIGVAAYQAPIAPLKNPLSDAAFVGGALTKQGFAVRSLNNPGRTELLDALQRFAADADGADAAIIYYAGHGVEVDGVNYLLPKDIQIPPSGKVQGADAARLQKSIFTDGAVMASRARDSLLGAARVRLLVLDACREDPFASSRASRGLRAVGGGLARETGGSATSVVTLMAAAPGQVAYDGDEPHHSPFAEALVQAIEQPGITIGDLPITVLTAVEETTKNESPVQSPDQQGIFRSSRWTFAAAPAKQDTEKVAEDRLKREQAFWQSVRGSDDPADVQAYLDKTQSGEFSGVFKPLALNRLRGMTQLKAEPAVTRAQTSIAPAADTLRQQARDAFLKGDFEAAARGWTEAAKQGSGAAMYNMGVLSLTGRGVPKNLSDAAHWFLLASQTGHAGGMENYALCLINGYGVTKNPTEGVVWLNKAASAGLPTAMALMGEIYMNGVGVKTDPVEAVRWFQRAVDAGDGPALGRLGEAYEQGVGVQRDLNRAFGLYRRAALSGQPDAMVKVGYFFEDGTLGPPDLLQAATWYQRAANAGNAEGMSSLAVLLESGRGVSKDDAAALNYYRMAADRNDARGLLGLGALYVRGVGVPEDDAAAVQYFTRAAALGSLTAMRDLAVMYETGRGVQRDAAEALRLYRQAMAAGDRDAAADVARLSSN